MVTAKTAKMRQDKASRRDDAKHLRTFQTPAERAFRYRVRARRPEGYKFKRQVPIGPCIADFVCLEANLVVELDGGQHAVRQDYDRERYAYLKSEGFRVLRVWNNDVTTNLNAVIESVLRELRGVAAPSP